MSSQDVESGIPQDARDWKAPSPEQYVDENPDQITEQQAEWSKERAEAIKKAEAAGFKNTILEMSYSEEPDSLPSESKSRVRKIMKLEGMIRNHPVALSRTSSLSRGGWREKELVNYSATAEGVMLDATEAKDVYERVAEFAFPRHAQTADEIRTDIKKDEEKNNYVADLEARKELVKDLL